MKMIKLFAVVIISTLTCRSFAQDTAYIHPDTSGGGWESIFNKDLTNAVFPAGVWKDSSGILTAAKDEAIWSKDEYDDFVLDLDFKNTDGTNSGVMVHATDMADWIPHSVEIQIADDYSKEWSSVSATWQCGAIFGHQAATNKILHKAGEWNHFTITCRGRKIWVVLNGTLVNTCDMSLFTSAKTNPDGSEVPSWLKQSYVNTATARPCRLPGKACGRSYLFQEYKN